MTSVLDHPTTQRPASATQADTCPVSLVSSSPARAGVGVHAPAPAGGITWPIETAVSTPHGVTIVKTRWNGDRWQHRSTSHSTPSDYHYTAAGTCSCWGFTRHHHCWHVDAAERIERSLHLDCWYALRFLRPCNSTEDLCYGLGLLSGMGLSEGDARAVINAERTVAA